MSRVEINRYAIEQASRRWRLIPHRSLAGTSLLTAITLLGTVAYVFAFSCGSGPVPSLLVPELFPAELRGKGGSVAMLSHWGWNAVVGAAFLPLITRYSIPTVYMGFASVAALSGLFTKFGIEETSKSE